MACSIQSRRFDATGRQRVTVDLKAPWGIESTDGTTVFEVFADQLEGDTAEN
jgi:hypothetical protein